MKVDIVTDGELRTTIPVVLEIKETNQKPKVSVKELGTVPVKKIDGYYHAEFFVQESGNYNLMVQSGEQKWTKELLIKEQEWISFNGQFGFTVVLFTLGVMGVFLWLKKIRKKLD